MTRSAPDSRPSSAGSGSGSGRSVNFAAVPISSYCRPLDNSETWAVYNYEAHARACSYCTNAYRVHKSGGRLCGEGNSLAQQVSSYIASDASGTQTFSRLYSDSTVYLELPPAYTEVRSLLRAVDRSERHPSKTPICGYDSSYYVAPRRSKTHRSSSRRHSDYYGDSYDNYGYYTDRGKWADYEAYADKKYRSSRAASGSKHYYDYDGYAVDYRQPSYHRYSSYYE